MHIQEVLHDDSKCMRVSCHRAGLFQLTQLFSSVFFRIGRFKPLLDCSRKSFPGEIFSSCLGPSVFYLEPGCRILGEEARSPLNLIILWDGAEPKVSFYLFQPGIDGFSAIPSEAWRLARFRSGRDRDGGSGSGIREGVLLGSIL